MRPWTWRNSLSGFRVRLSKAASKQLEDLPATVRTRAAAALRAIQDNPSLGRCLQGEFAGARRYRVGSYRIIYRVDETEHVVLVASISHRSRAYRHQ